MYRQILRAVKDRDLQRIVLFINGELVDFQLNTVTYGQASAPHDATRCLVQLAKDGAETYPLAAEALLEHTYVDDCLSGGVTLEQAMQRRDQLIALLGTAGIRFSNSKWRANHPELLLEKTSSSLPSALAMRMPLESHGIHQRIVSRFQRLLNSLRRPGHLPDDWRCR
jgi:hypothetical protein